VEYRDNNNKRKLRIHKPASEILIIGPCYLVQYDFLLDTKRQRQLAHWHIKDFQDHMEDKIGQEIVIESSVDSITNVVRDDKKII
jgi:hypothetical protein